MKSLNKLIATIVILTGGLFAAYSQNSHKVTANSKASELKQMIESGRYTFEANLAYPLRGGEKVLTSDYDFKVSKDTIAAFLPYFGQAYIAPANPLEGGIKFTSSNFSYTAKATKKGGWEIVFKPKDKNIGDMKDVQQLRLTISPNGSSSLQVISTNRDPISFGGNIRG